MKKWKVKHIILSLLCLTICISSCQEKHKRTETITQDYQPDRDLGVLFADVQTAEIFDDYKTFVDCSPVRNPSEIVRDYESQRSRPEFSLEVFVQENFKMPLAVEKGEIDQNKDMITHLRNHWKYLIRTANSDEQYTTMINLPEPFVVPGGRFREMFYWDSYFTIIGLLESNEDTLALGMIKNFDYLIQEYGFIPNGNRTYFSSRSQPPFFAQMLKIYGEKHGIETIIPFLPSLEKEYDFWMDHAMPPGMSKRVVTLDDSVQLNRYYGTLTIPRAEGYGKEVNWASALPESERPHFHQELRAVCESGWDFSSRWFADGKSKITTNCEDITPICLNSLLYGMEKQLSTLYEHTGHPYKADHYQKQAMERKNAIRTHLWSDASGYFKDYNYQEEAHTQILSLATMYPLFFGIADDTQAARVAEVVEKELLFDGGVVTSTINTGEQWDAPNGWAPLQWITVMGLDRYGHHELASKIANRWLALNEKVYREEGKMMEKYNVMDTTLMGGGGEYQNQDGFGWTNGVALGLHAYLNQEKTVIQ